MSDLGIALYPPPKWLVLSEFVVRIKSYIHRLAVFKLSKGVLFSIINETLEGVV